MSLDFYKINEDAVVSSNICFIYIYINCCDSFRYLLLMIARDGM